MFLIDKTDVLIYEKILELSDFDKLMNYEHYFTHNNIDNICKAEDNQQEIKLLASKSNKKKLKSITLNLSKKNNKINI